MSNKIRLIVAGLALVVALIGFSSFVTIAAPSAPAATDSATFDSSCGTTIGEGRWAVTVSCWVENAVQKMRFWQPGMVGSDPTKPAFQAVFEMPQAASCTWWGVNASVTSTSGEVEIPAGSENVPFTVSSRTTATVTDQIGGQSAGFDIWCSGVTGDIVPTATPTQTPTATATPEPTHTALPCPPGYCETPTSTATNTPVPTATATATGTPVPAEYVLEKYEDELYLQYQCNDSDELPASSLTIGTFDPEFPSVVVLSEWLPEWHATMCGGYDAIVPQHTVQIQIPGETKMSVGTEAAEIGWLAEGRWFYQGTHKPGPTEPPTATNTPVPTVTPTATATPTQTPPAPPAWTCDRPMTAIAGSPTEPGDILTAAYQPRQDPVWAGEALAGLIIGQWGIVGQPEATHFFCTILPSGEWTVQNDSGSVLTADGATLISGSGSFVLPHPTWVWVQTNNGSQLQGPPWKLDLPAVMAQQPTPITTATPRPEGGHG